MAASIMSCLIIARAMTALAAAATGVLVPGAANATHAVEVPVATATPPLPPPGFDARPGSDLRSSFAVAPLAMGTERRPASLLAAAVAVLAEPPILAAVAIGLAFTIAAARERRRRRPW